MLTVDIKVNEKLVAQIQIQNVSGLAPVSDYAVSWSEHGFSPIGLEETAGTFLIRQLPRNLGPLALLTRILLRIIETRR